MREITKDQAQAIHFKIKLRERYGIGRMNRFEYRDLCAVASQSQALVRQSERVSVRKVPIRGIEILCVFDSFRGTLVTVFPPEVVSIDQIHQYVERRRNPCD